MLGRSVSAILYEANHSSPLGGWNIFSSCHRRWFEWYILVGVDPIDDYDGCSRCRSTRVPSICSPFDPIGQKSHHYFIQLNDCQHGEYYWLDRVRENCPEPLNCHQLCRRRLVYSFGNPGTVFVAPTWINRRCHHRRRWIAECLRCS